jgi:hypothetical protein
MSDLRSYADVTGFENRIAARFSSSVTRRGLLQRTMQLAAASAALVSVKLVWPGSAQALNCTFSVDYWGCYCSSTPSCPSCCQDTGGGPVAYDKCCGSATKRCDYWTTYPYCWCSQSCCLGGANGFYSCCDCWQYGSSTCGSPSGNGTKCTCKAYIVVGLCD